MVSKVLKMKSKYPKIITAAEYAIKLMPKRLITIFKKISKINFKATRFAVKP